MKNKRDNILVNLDWLTIAIYFVLVLLGWLNIYSAVYDDSHSSIFDVSQRYGKQLIWIAASVLLIFIVLIVDSKFYSAFSYPLYAIGILLLISVLLFGVEVKASKSWFEIGSFRIQPVEFAKITICLALAHFLSSENFSFGNSRKVLGVLCLLGLPVLLILLQNDTGSSLVFFSFVFVLFREGLNKTLFITVFFIIALFILALLVKIEYLLIAALTIGVLAYCFVSRRTMFSKVLFYSFLLFVVISALFYIYIPFFNNNLLLLVFLNIGAVSLLMLIVYLIKKNNTLLLYLILIVGVNFFIVSVDYIFNNILQEHQQNRINGLLGKNDDPLGVDYNVNQSKIAIGSGGFSGKGFLNGTQTKYNFVPEQSTDFIFCTIGEEWGFIGTTVVLALFIFLIIRIIILAERQRSAFSRIYGYGVASVLFFHVVVNIGMTIGLAPVIGIPLPFFSYGGSSLWAFTIMLFIFIKLDSDRLQVFR
ncbi:MAG: rod shape-determining protein RodA [Bacteroidales bacterium]|jgi:rod shape determining protein RodA|nr:rod shape-determining protein RodA [Bacteroidales bacterium]